MHGQCRRVASGGVRAARWRRRATQRKNVLLGNPYEEIVGFSRAVRVGPFVSVGGTAPIGADGETVGVGDVAAQTRRCFEIIEEALQGAGASLDDVVSTRLLLTNVADSREVIEVRKEFVGRVKPVDTIVQVDGFVNPDWLIEVEADAIITDPAAWTIQAHPYRSLWMFGRARYERRTRSLFSYGTIAG